MFGFRYSSRKLISTKFLFSFWLGQGHVPHSKTKKFKMWLNIQKIQKIQHCSVTFPSVDAQWPAQWVEWRSWAQLSSSPRPGHILNIINTLNSQHRQQSQLSIAQTLNWRISTHLHTVTARTMVPDSVVLVVLVLASTGLASHGDSVLAAVLGGGAKQVPGLGCLACR